MSTRPERIALPLRLRIEVHKGVHDLAQELKRTPNNLVETALELVLGDPVLLERLKQHRRRRTLGEVLTQVLDVGHAMHKDAPVSTAVPSGVQARGANNHEH
jgi:hypothetical protein